MNTIIAFSQHIAPAVQFTFHHSIARGRQSRHPICIISCFNQLSFGNIFSPDFIITGCIGNPVPCTVIIHFMNDIAPAVILLLNSTVRIAQSNRVIISIKPGFGNNLLFLVIFSSDHAVARSYNNRLTFRIIVTDNSSVTDIIIFPGVLRISAFDHDQLIGCIIESACYNRMIAILPHLSCIPIRTGHHLSVHTEIDRFQIVPICIMVLEACISFDKNRFPINTEIRFLQRMLGHIGFLVYAGIPGASQHGLTIKSVRSKRHLALGSPICFFHISIRFARCKCKLVIHISIDRGRNIVIRTILDSNVCIPVHGIHRSTVKSEEICLNDLAVVVVCIFYSTIAFRCQDQLPICTIVFFGYQSLFIIIFKMDFTRTCVGHEEWITILIIVPFLQMQCFIRIVFILNAAVSFLAGNRIALHIIIGTGSSGALPFEIGITIDNLMVALSIIDRIPFLIKIILCRNLPAVKGPQHLMISQLFNYDLFVILIKKELVVNCSLRRPILHHTAVSFCNGYTLAVRAIVNNLINTTLRSQRNFSSAISFFKPVRGPICIIIVIISSCRFLIVIFHKHIGISIGARNQVHITIIPGILCEPAFFVCPFIYGIVGALCCVFRQMTILVKVFIFDRFIPCVSNL